MSTDTKTDETGGGWILRALNGIERVANRLPDPVTLFIISIAIVMVLSAVLAAMGTSITVPAEKGPQEIAAVSLLDGAMLRRLFVELPTIFTSFPPLGIVLVMMVAVGLAERSGLFAAALRGLVGAVPKSLLTLTIVFAGVNASLASDAGYVVLIPLAGAVFAAGGRHPIAGLSAAFSGVAGGFAANLLITPGDALLSGISTAAAHIIDPDYTVPITANWYFMAALVPLYTIVGALVCEWIVEPRLNQGPAWLRVAPAEHAPDQATREARGLRYAGLALIPVLALVVWFTWAPGHVLRDIKPLVDAGLDPANAAAAPFTVWIATFTPLFQGMITIMFLVFLVCGLAYGIGARTIASDKDAVKMAQSGVTEMSGFLVLVFFAAVFVWVFRESNMGSLLAFSGADALRNLGLGNFPLVLLLGVITMSMLTDLLVGSASAKWAILAPILVPILMQLGIAPEVTQAAYRVGDSTTNMITPFMSYFPLILVMARKYMPDYGIGSMIALMLPYTIAFWIFTGLFFSLWFLMGIPFGPGVSSVYLPG
jgi:aminobenzoyl-glutamate transport protein